MKNISRFSFLATIVLQGVVLTVPQISLAGMTVSMRDNSFSPQTVAVNIGDTVAWSNNGSLPHSLIAVNGAFNSGPIAPGLSYSTTFTMPGTYIYYDSIYGTAASGMMGTVLVGAVQQAPMPVYGTVVPGAPQGSVAQLQAQAQALMNQIAAMQGQVASNVGATVVDSAACPRIGVSLKPGSSGDDVTRLQQFLATDPSVYPEARITGYYGALTQAAVERWQAKNNIVSSGTPASTGYGVVGPRTAAAMSLLCSTRGSTAPVGGFITLTPVSGNAPLTVNVTATVNTTNSCGAATYTLDFGDGTPLQQIPLPPGSCTPLNQTYPHTYLYGGTYYVKLAAGVHSTSATVVVSGAAAPPTGQFTQGLPLETYNANPKSGSAPLLVYFSGIVNSNDAGFCNGGCASILDFGDGSSASINLPAVAGGWLNYSVSHIYTSVGGFKATLYQGGAGTSQPVVGSATIIVGASGGGSVSSSAYTAPTVTSGSNPLTFTIQFDLPSSCTGYDFSWGDSTSHTTQIDGGSSCAQGQVTKSFTHTYTTSGAFTIVLKRGPLLGRVDDVSVTITQ
jgi:plastocyanin